MRLFDYKNLGKGLLLGGLKLSLLLSSGVFNDGGSVPFQRPPRKSKVIYVYIIRYLRGGV